VRWNDLRMVWHYAQLALGTFTRMRRLLPRGVEQRW
jgi:hypothetical protein